MPHTRCCSTASASDCSASSSWPRRHWVKPRQRFTERAANKPPVAWARARARSQKSPELVVGQQQDVGGHDPEQAVVDREETVALQGEPGQPDRAGPVLAVAQQLVGQRRGEHARTVARPRTPRAPGPRGRSQQAARA